MCGINAVINGSVEDISLMINESSKRGVKSDLKKIQNAWVHFSWLPITDANAPMQPYKSEGYTVWFNGFISNYKKLAVKYNIQLETNCDTELLVKFIGKFKLKQLNELNGFFAVLVFDGYGFSAFTDRYGIKKLYRYISPDGKTFISSELKSILAANPQIKVRENYLDEFKYSLGVMNHQTLYDGVDRAPCLPFVKPDKINISYPDAVEKLRELFIQSCERNKTELNDCVFLSGGIDSGIIAKYMKPKFSFSMDYVDYRFSETENIKRNSTGKHISMICNDELFSEYSEKLIDCLDDPKVGSSYTNFALTELASNFCTVIYSGAGGDEFFGGYPHRKNKLINEVIKRTSEDGPKYFMSHFDYDLKFLRGVLNVEDSISGFNTMEARYPLLDNDLVDFALSLPNDYLQGKKILKDISGLHPLVLNGKKKGFSNPFMNNDQWVEFIINRLKQKHEHRFL